jgi:hypothetical protein
MTYGPVSRGLSPDGYVVPMHLESAEDGYLGGFSLGPPFLTLLKCASTYPANPENSILLTIPDLRDLFQCKVGLSDHTLGIGASITTVVLGATFIESI